MTDARLPERYLNDRRLLRLPDAAFRGYVTSLLWTVSNRTDGRLDDADLAHVPGLSPVVVALLSEAGLIERDGDGWHLVDYETTQTSRHDLEVLENGRRREREKKAKQRAQKTDGEPEEGTVPRDSPRGRSPGTTQERTGEARPGLETTDQTQDAKTEKTQDAHVRTREAEPPIAPEPPPPAVVAPLPSTAAASWTTEAEQVRRCQVCRSPMDARMWAAGDRTHATCDPDPEPIFEGQSAAGVTA